MRNQLTRHAKLSAFLAVAITTAPALADGQEYNFKDPKGVNSVVFIMDSTLEPIMGLAGGVSGKVTFDPTAPKKISGKIVIESKSLHIANRGMKKKAQSEGWLDVENHPTIEFTLKSVSKSTALGEGKFELEVAGDFTCKGVTKPLATKVTATYLKDKLSERGGGKAGDLLILRSNFTIKRSDFGIKAGMGSMVVADEIQLRVSIVGTFKRE